MPDLTMQGGWVAVRSALNLRAPRAARAQGGGWVVVYCTCTAAAVEVTEREDLRSRSPSPELPAPEFPDTDPLASSTDTEPMTPDQS